MREVYESHGVDCSLSFGGTNLDIHTNPYRRNELLDSPLTEKGRAEVGRRRRSSRRSRRRSRSSWVGRATAKEEVSLK
jgi:hypothetical protein